MHCTLARLTSGEFPSLRRKPLDTLQVNLGYRCNQACLHCHVNAGPTRTEMMSEDVLQTVIDYLQVARLPTLDITGGAPELHPGFRHLVRAARACGARVIDRCNLTILEQPEQGDLAQFLAAQKVEITASLPCYLESNVDKQRGAGVFAASIRGLRSLNALGYGRSASALVLNLVFNPQGPVLPPSQSELESTYRRILAERYGIEFTRLYTLVNMPIQRFGSTLVSKRQFDPYMHLLRSSFRPENLEGVMCRTLISVDWQGWVYDCDFNQMLGLPLTHGTRARVRLADLLGAELDGNPIAVADHCYGCTAGQGSSCGGALAG